MFIVNIKFNYFNLFIPCGISDKAVTSLNRELGREVGIAEIKEKLKKNFGRLFEATVVVKEFLAG